MNRIPCQDYINKIILLENHSYRMRNYVLLNPPDYDGSLDVVVIQKIAKLLSKHIGYDKLVFTVSFKEFANSQNAYSSSNTAGNILLDNNEDVLIHISRDLNNYPESLLATLSHEISHKYIHFNNLTFKNSYENEIFTDLTSVYLGFGKLMLNGVEVIKKETVGNVVKTYTKKVGYLNREQLAFIYLFVNYSHELNSSIFYSNLRNEVKDKVKKIDKKYKVLFSNIKYYRNMMLKINEIRYKIAYLDKLTRITKPSNVNEINEYIKYEFINLNKLESELKFFKKEYLTKVLTKRKKIRRLRKEIPKIEFNLIKYNELLKVNRVLLNKNLEKNLTNNNLNIIQCPICSKKLQIKSKRVGTIICPFCNFNFAADTIESVNNYNFYFKLKRSISKLINN